MTTNPTVDSPQEPFVVWQQYSDRSNDVQFIYIGNDKSAAFDALEAFIFDNSADADTIRITYAKDAIK